MNIYYLHESGIKFWEHLDAIESERFSTLTLIKGSINEFRPFWQKMAIDLLKFFPKFLIWKTLGYPLDGKVQEFKFLKKIKTTLNEKSFYKKNKLTGVYSYIIFDNESHFNFNLYKITQSNYMLGIFSNEKNLNIRRYWEMLKEGDMGVTANNIQQFLNRFKNTVILRVIETETHAAIQFFALDNELDFILKSLVGYNTIEISENDVSKTINNL